MIDQRTQYVKVNIIDSFTSFFDHKNIKKFDSYVERVIKERRNTNPLTVCNIQMTRQKTCWECGYRVLKVIQLLLENNLDVDRLILFNYSLFIN